MCVRATPHHCSVKMASGIALSAILLLIQNYPGQQNNSGFRVCHSSIHEALDHLSVVAQDLQTQFITAFDIVTDVFLLLLCFVWKNKFVRENFY